MISPVVLARLSSTVDKMPKVEQNKKAFNHTKRKYAHSKKLRTNLKTFYLFYLPPHEWSFWRTCWMSTTLSMNDCGPALSDQTVLNPPKKICTLFHHPMNDGFDRQCLSAELDQSILESIKVHIKSWIYFAESPFYRLPFLWASSPLWLICVTSILNMKLFEVKLKVVIWNLCVVGLLSKGAI